MSVFDMRIFYNVNMDKKFNTGQYQNYYSLPAEERYRIAAEIAQTREQMFRDMIEQNRRIQAKNEAFIEEQQEKFDIVDGIIDFIRLWILFK